jgi:hypothetical protein
MEPALQLPSNDIDSATLSGGILQEDDYAQRPTSRAANQGQRDVSGATEPANQGR